MPVPYKFFQKAKKEEYFPSFSPMISSKMRMLPLCTSLWHYTGGTSQCNNARKIKNSLPYWKEWNIMSLFSGNVIIYVENVMGRIEKLLELRSESKKVQDISIYKIHCISIFYVIKKYLLQYHKNINYLR